MSEQMNQFGFIFGMVAFHLPTPALEKPSKGLIVLLTLACY